MILIKYLIINLQSVIPSNDICLPAVDALEYYCSLDYAKFHSGLPERFPLKRGTIHMFQDKSDILVEYWKVT